MHYIQTDFIVVVWQYGASAWSSLALAALQGIKGFQLTRECSNIPMYTEWLYTTSPDHFSFDVPVVTKSKIYALEPEHS